MWLWGRTEPTLDELYDKSVPQLVKIICNQKEELKQKDNIIANVAMAKFAKDGNPNLQINAMRAKMVENAAQITKWQNHYNNLLQEYNDFRTFHGERPFADLADWLSTVDK